MSHHTHILIFSIGPVQSFIAEARRTIDLYAGSQMLAKIACAAAQAVLDNQGELISPSQDSLHCGDTDQADTPNVIIALVNNPEEVARQAGEQATKRWLEFANIAWKELVDRDDQVLQKIWNRQRNNQLEFYWIATEYKTNDYKESYKIASRTLAARKWTRDFGQEYEDGFKDSFSGSRSALHSSDETARQYWQRMRSQKKGSQLQEGELLDTIGVMKRFAVPENFPSTSTVAVTYFIKQSDSHKLGRLNDLIQALNEKIRVMPQDYHFENGLEMIREQYQYGYLRRLTKNFTDESFPYGGDLLYLEGYSEQRLEENYGPLPCSFDQIEEDIETIKSALKELYKSRDARPSPYYAILQMDGDSMGKHISQSERLEDHQNLSKGLANFTKAANKIVQKQHGHLVYAGGDDVLAFFPVETALAAANALVKAYQENFKDWEQKDEDGNDLPFTASAGIAFAHYLYPLDGVLAATRRAEKRAKNKYGRDALCVTVLRRSGETLEVGGKWGNEAKSSTVELVNHLKELLESKQLSSRFPYNVLRDASVVTAIENKQQARTTILRQLVNRHKASSVTKDNVQQLVENWVAWTNQYDDQIPYAPDSQKKQDQGFYELGHWFVLARWLAGGGQE